MNHLLKIALLAFAALGLSACPGPETKSSSDGPVTTYFLSGDPHLLIEGAQLSPASPFTAENIANLNNYNLLGYVDFKENQKRKTQDRDLQKENAASEGSDSSGKYDLEIRVHPVADGWNVGVFSDKLLLHFSSQADGRLQMDSISSGNHSEKIQILHWSVTPDQNMISLLLESKDPDEGRILSAAYFEKKTASPLAMPQGPKKYRYSTGPGQKLGWPTEKTLNLGICGAAVRDQAIIEFALGNWQQALRGRLKISAKATNQFAPFSDLNQHCLYLVNTYLMEERPDYGNYGLTYSIRSRNRPDFIDSDILIFEGELKKIERFSERQGTTGLNLKKLMAKKRQRTYMHELGHLFGLDHQFDGTPSIMSYDFSQSGLEAYDIEAIQELYPLRK